MTLRRALPIAVIALLLIVAGFLAILIGQNNAAATQDDHDRQVAICAAQVDDPYGAGQSELVRCIEDLKQQ